MNAIYLIRNTANGKFYVGSAVDIDKRIGQHIRGLNAGTHANRKLQNAWNKYGKASFTFTVIEEVLDPQTLLDREQFWLDTMMAIKLGYNLTPTAGSLLGMRHSDETKQRMSLSASGKTKSPEHVAKVTAALKGRKMTDEQRQKMRDKKLGTTHKPHTAETKAKMSLASKGKKKSAAHCAALSVARKLRYAKNVIEPSALCGDNPT